MSGGVGADVVFFPLRRGPLLVVLRQSRADPRFLVSVALWRPFSALHGRFTPARMIATLEVAGFRDVTCEPVLGGLGLIGRGGKSSAEVE